MLQTVSTATQAVLYGSMTLSLIAMIVAAVKHSLKERKRKPKPERMTEGTRFYARQNGKLIACKLTDNHKDIKVIYATTLNGKDAIRVEYSEVESIM